MIEPVYEKINYSVKSGVVTEQIKAESKTEILSESVKAILNVWAWSTVNDCEISDGKIRYGGRVIFYVSYLDADGSVKKVECGNEFAGTIIDGRVNDGCRAYATAVVDKTEADVSGIKLTLSAFVTIKADVTDCAEIDALSGGDSLIIDRKEIPLTKSLGVRHGSYPIEEEFELNYTVEEVLSHRVQAIITAVQCGVGAIIVDGEAVISAIMLQKTDKSDIIKEIKTVPFRMEIDCEEAMPAMQATARVKEKSFKTEITVDEDSGKSIVSASVVLGFEGEAFSLSSVWVAEDVFSTEQEIQSEKHDLSYYKPCEMRTLTALVNGKAAVEELPAGAIILAVGGETAEITATDCKDDGLKFTGVINAVGFFRDGENRPFTRKLEMPFEVTLDCAFDCGIELESFAKAVKARARITSLTEIELETETIFTVYPSEKCDLSIVKSLEMLGEKPKNTSALSVYIPTEGEELWSLAKRLNVSPETLVQANPDLCFPLTGSERIVVYRQK